MGNLNNLKTEYAAHIAEQEAFADAVSQPVALALAVPSFFDILRRDEKRYGKIPNEPVAVGSVTDKPVEGDEQKKKDIARELGVSVGVVDVWLLTMTMTELEILAEQIVSKGPHSAEALRRLQPGKAEEKKKPDDAINFTPLRIAFWRKKPDVEPEDEDGKKKRKRGFLGRVFDLVEAAGWQAYSTLRAVPIFTPRGGSGRNLKKLREATDQIDARPSPVAFSYQAEAAPEYNLG